MQPKTNHFELADLIDYVRGTGPPERLEQMRRHLETDRCERCRKAASLLSGAYGAARELASFDVPEANVRRARAIFQPAASAGWQSLPALVARLVSVAQPIGAGAGLRATGPRKEMVYEAGHMRARFDVISDGKGNRFLIGTLAHLEAPQRTYGDCPVLLQAAGSTVHQTRTSEFGELYLELGRHRNLRLVVLPHGENQRLEISIED